MTSGKSSGLEDCPTMDRGAVSTEVRGGGRAKKMEPPITALQMERDDKGQYVGVSGAWKSQVASSPLDPPGRRPVL